MRTIAIKNDILWIRWVNNNYIKKNNLELMISLKSVAWAVKKIIDSQKVLRDINSFKVLLSHLCKNSSKIRKDYVAMKPQMPKVSLKVLSMKRYIQDPNSFCVLQDNIDCQKRVYSLQKIKIQILPIVTPLFAHGGRVFSI